MSSRFPAIGLVSLVITREQAIETHRISRLTTVNWKDKQGKDCGLQFVSLRGFHQRSS